MTQPLALIAAWLGLACHGLAQSAPPAEANIQAARAAEQRRIETIARITPSVVCIYDSARRGGGSGVIIDPAGYGLTNYHVVAGMVETRKGLGGISDGQVYELQVLGVDKTGDVAMFRLLGKEKWDYAELGDSDAVRVGQLAIAAGNPFVLAEDNTPTITLGRVTGVGRYQKGMGNALVYTDCIQTDAPINPGNSGGPLFDIEGRVIGINGRISIAAGVRGRFNVGLGYAISANQIKRFMPALRAGLFARHGTLQATVNADLLFNELLEDGPAWEVGIRPGDRLIRFGNRHVASANHFASLLGVYPEEWPVPISYERDGEMVPAIARLEPLSVRQKEPFEVDAAINRSAVERVLSRYRAAAGTMTPPTSAEFTWTSTRRRVGDDSEVQWLHACRPDGTSVHRQVHADGSFRREILCQGDQANLVVSSEALALPPREALTWTGSHLYHQLLAFAGGELDPGSFSHVGGDARLILDAEGRLTDSRLLEVLEHRTASGLIVRFGFDAAAGLVRQLRVLHSAAGLEAILRLDAFVRVDGAMLPTRIEVDSGDGRYVEELSFQGAGS